MNYARFEPTPPMYAAILEPYIKDKVVMELGAGDGEFAKALAKYSNKVIAVESDRSLAAYCVAIPEIETIYSDFNKVDLHKADVLYFFLSFCGAYNVTRLIQRTGWHGTVISHYYPLHEIPGQYWKPDEVLHADLPFLIYKV